MEILFYYIINLLYLGYFARRYWRWYLKAVGRGLLTDIDGIADAKHMVANENQMLILLYRLTKYKILKLRSAKDYFVLGNSLFLLAEYESAIECYNNALRIDGKGKYAWYNLQFIVLFLVYFAHTIWLFGNPLIGNPFEPVNMPQNNLIYLFSYAAIFSLMALVQQKGLFHDRIYLITILFNGFIFSVVLMIDVFMFYKESYANIFLVIEMSIIFCLI